MRPIVETAYLRLVRIRCRLDFHLEGLAFVCVRGKGRRERLCPLLPQSARLVCEFLSSEGRDESHQRPFLRNGHGDRLGRHGARYILLKYLRRATRSMPSLARVGISPHTMRHTKAMHLLQSGVPLVMVNDSLGHVDLEVNRGRCPSGSRHEARRAQFGQWSSSDASANDSAILKPHQVARSPLTSIM